MKLTTIWTLPGMDFRERLNRTGELTMRAIAHRLPRRLAYWSLIDSGVRHVGNDVVPEVTYMTILERAAPHAAAPPARTDGATMADNGTPAPARHSVTWQDGIPTFRCHGDRASACHQYPSCGHEYWPCGEHGDEPHDDCWQLPWLGAEPEETWFDGGSTLTAMPEIDGDIETEWVGDCLIWCYVDSDDLAGTAAPVVSGGAR